jgi:hypothetical protein
LEHDSGVYAPLEPNDLPPEHFVDFEVLRQATSEDEFVHQAFELAKEAASMLALTVGIRTRATDGGIPRNQAIVAGHLIRMVKLTIALVRQIADNHGGGQQMQLTRQFLDSMSAADYLLEAPQDRARFDAFVYNSLIADREFQKEVQRNIDARAGVALPIETRILRSIDRAFRDATVNADELPSRNRNAWPKSIQQLMNRISPSLYSAYRMGSNSIHGTWTDLIRNHLNPTDRGFEVVTDEETFRPQPILTMGLLSADISLKYLAVYAPEALPSLAPRLKRLRSDLRQIDQLHEDLLGS